MSDSLSPYAEKSPREPDLMDPPPPGGDVFPPKQNTDRELWRDPDSDEHEGYQDRIFVTEDNLVGISVAGHVQARPLRAWAELAMTALKQDGAVATEAPRPDWSLRLELLRIFADGHVPVEQWAAIGRDVLRFVTEESSP